MLVPVMVFERSVIARNEVMGPICSVSTEKLLAWLLRGTKNIVCRGVKYKETFLVNDENESFDFRDKAK